MTLARSILVPVDGSKFMERNISYACEMAKTTGAKLTLIHVVTLPIAFEPDSFIDPKPFEQAGKKCFRKRRRSPRAKE